MEFTYFFFELSCFRYGLFSYKFRAICVDYLIFEASQEDTFWEKKGSRGDTCK